MNKDNLFLAGNEGRHQVGKSLVRIIKYSSKDHEISVTENVANLIDSELDLNGEIVKYADNG